MSKLTDTEKSFLALVARSPDRGEGWRHVSAACMLLVAKFTRSELIEVEPFIIDGGRVRLTDKGATVVEYLV